MKYLSKILLIFLATFMWVGIGTMQAQKISFEADSVLLEQNYIYGKVTASSAIFILDISKKVLLVGKNSYEIKHDIDVRDVTVDKETITQYSFGIEGDRRVTIYDYHNDKKADKLTLTAFKKQSMRDYYGKVKKVK